jgi:ABC-2 type transport system ATP-binding protein
VISKATTPATADLRATFAAEAAPRELDGMTEAIAVTGLVKTYGDVTALDGLDLEVAGGEVHGFLGPNGAGKTTAIRILLGLLRADAGTARVLDGDPWDDAVPLHEVAPPG